MKGLKDGERGRKKKTNELWVILECEKIKICRFFIWKKRNIPRCGGKKGQKRF